MNRKIIIVILLMSFALGLVTGDEQKVYSATIGTAKFYDAFGKKHTIKIKSAVPKNPYRKTNFQFLKKDAKGKVLVKKSNSRKVRGQTRGYKGIIKYDDEYYESRFGIDVSRHQGKINWKKVKKAGVEFAFLRIGYRSYGKKGQLFEDAQFKRNIREAHKAGIEVGVYFFSQAKNKKEAIKEAKYTIKLLGKNKLELPVVFDPEHIVGDKARTDKVSGKQFTKNALAFCNVIEKRGYKPMIYSNLKWEAFEFDMVKIKKYPIWYADYEKYPQTPYNFQVWQYSQGGIIDGIKGAVDLDLYFNKK